MFTVRLGSYALLLIGIVRGSAASPPPAPHAVQIAAGVEMPLINLGGIEMAGYNSNFTAWLSLGGRGVDTALMYGDDVQSQVGAAVRAAVKSGIPRSDVFVTTKIPCCPMHPNATFTTWCHDNPGRWNATANVEHDYEVLGLDTVDLVLLHWPCATLADTVNTYRALQPLVADGRARAIGVSNFNATFLEQFLADPSVTVKPAVDQCGYSIHGHGGNAGAVTPLGRDTATRNACRQHGITFSAYSPLGGLSGIDVLHDPVVVKVAAAHNTSTAQVALRWVVQQGVVAVTASDKARYDVSDLDIFDFELTGNEMSALSSE